MSVSMVMFPVAIVMAITTKKTVAEQRKALTEFTPMQTIFSDTALLEQTLRERGLAVTVLSEHQLICQSGEVRLQYARRVAGEPFWLTVSGVQNMDGFLAELECFEQEYRHNVQSYTYNRLKSSLGSYNMKVAEEILLEDNSILLTIDI